MDNGQLDVRKQEVFEYLVVKHPTVAEAEQGAVSEIVVPLTQICANDQKGALMRANRAVPEEHMKHESRLEVAIRPF